MIDLRLRGGKRCSRNVPKRTRGKQKNGCSKRGKTRRGGVRLENEMNSGGRIADRPEACPGKRTGLHCFENSRRVAKKEY